MGAPESDIPGTLVYKCKLCDELIRREHTTDLWDECYTLANGHTFDNKYITKFQTHICASGSVGIIELVGGIPD